MKRNCLFIDDNPDQVNSVLDELTEVIGPRHNMEIKCELLGLGLGSAFVDDNRVIDLELVEKEIKEKLMRQMTFDLVVCDFDLEANDVNGLDVAMLIRECDKNCVIVLYSGNVEKIANYIANISDQSEQVRRIKKLVHCKISEFIDRSTDFESNLIHTLKKKIPFEVRLVKKLEELEGLKLVTGYTPFEGKNFKDISHEVKNQSYHGKLFQEELIDRAISQLVDLNPGD